MSMYLEPIQVGTLAFFGFLFIMTIPYMIIQYQRVGRVSPWKFGVSFSFVLYLLCAYALTIFPLPDPAVVAQSTAPTMNLHIMLFVHEFLDNSGFVLSNPHSWLHSVKSFSFIQPFCNLLLTVPFGFYLRYLYKRKAIFTIIASFLLSLSFELIQLSALFGLYPRPYRLFDVDDLLLNTIGGLVGFVLAMILVNLLPDLDAVKSDKAAIGYIRRLIAFGIDLLITGILSIFTHYILVFAVIFLLIPLIFRATLGQLLVAVKFDSSNRWKIAFRQILSFINLLPMIALVYFLGQSGTIDEQLLAQNVLLILLALALCILPLLDALVNLFTRNKMLWFERLSNTKLVPRKLRN